LPVAYLGNAHNGHRYHHPVYRDHAGAQAGAIEAATGVPQYWPDRLHPAGDGRVHVTTPCACANGREPCYSRLLRRDLACAQPRPLQRPAVLERRVHALRHRHARPEQARRPDEVHACHRSNGSGRIFLDFWSATVQWVCKQMGHLCRRHSGWGERKVPTDVRTDCDSYQRAHAGVFCEIFRRKLSGPHQRACSQSRPGRKPGGRMGHAGAASSTRVPMHADRCRPCAGMQRAIDSSREGFGVELARTGPIVTSVSGISLVTSTALLMPVAVLGVVAAMLLLVRWISQLGGAPRRKADVWLCGYAREAESNRYVAHNFYGEIKRLFGSTDLHKALR